MSRLKSSDIQDIVLQTLRGFAAHTFGRVPMAAFVEKGLFTFEHGGEMFPYEDESGVSAVDVVRARADALPRATASRAIELAQEIVCGAFTREVQASQRRAIEAHRVAVIGAERASVRVVNARLALRYPDDPATGRILRFVRDGVERFQFVSKSDVSGQVIEVLEFTEIGGLWALREHVANVTPKAGRVTRHLLAA